MLQPAFDTRIPVPPRGLLCGQETTPALRARVERSNQLGNRLRWVLSYGNEARGPGRGPGKPVCFAGELMPVYQRQPVLQEDNRKELFMTSISLCPMRLTLKGLGLLVSQSHGGIHRNGSPGWNQAREDRHRRQQ